MQTPSFTTQDVGLFDRLGRIFYDPQTSFVAVRERETSQDWFAPIAIAVLVGLMSHFITMDISHDPNLPEFQKKLESLTEEQRQIALDNLEGSREHSWMQIPVVAFMSLVVIGVVLLGLAKGVFQAEVTLREMLVLKGYASILLVPETVLRTLMVLVKGSPSVHTGPGAFVPAEWAGTFVGNLMTAINLFDLWQGWVMGVGLAVLASVSEKKAFFAIFTLYLLWIVVGAAVETVAPRIPPPPPDIPPSIE